MRLFFALPVEGSLALDIDHWRKQNFPIAQGKVPAANYHITLAFLGDVATSKLDALCQRVDDLCTAPYAQPGELLLDTVGYFAKPGILWVGPKHWPDHLSRLASALFHFGKALGSHKGKQDFQPHITLYRRCDAPVQALQPPDFTLPYGELVLYESVNGKSGVHYQECVTWPLNARPAKKRSGRPGLGTRT